MTLPRPHWVRNVKRGMGTRMREYFIMTSFLISRLPERQAIHVQLPSWCDPCCFWWIGKDPGTENKVSGASWCSEDEPEDRDSIYGERSWGKTCLKAGVHLKAVFWLGIMFLMQISRLRFKQSRICSLITHIYVLRRFVNFLVIFRFIWRQIVFLKGLVKFMEIGNFEDLVLF